MNDKVDAAQLSYFFEVEKKSKEARLPTWPGDEAPRHLRQEWAKKFSAASTLQENYRSKCMFLAPTMARQLIKLQEHADNLAAALKTFETITPHHDMIAIRDFVKLKLEEHENMK